MQKIQISNAEETSIRQSLADISFHTTLFIFFLLLFLKPVASSWEFYHEPYVHFGVV